MVQLLLVEAIEPLVGLVTNEAWLIVFKQLRSTLRWIAETARHSPNEVSLETFVREAAAKLSKTLEMFAPDHDDQVFTYLQRAIARVARLKLCSVCNAQYGRVCDGKSQDEVQLAYLGGCLQPLRERLDLAFNTASDYYRSYAKSTPAQVCACLSTHHWPEPPSDLPPKMLLSGETVHDDHGRERRSTVTLFSFPFDLRWESCLATHYVFFHECLVHVFQEITNGPRATYPDPGDPFVEGWMDWLACELLCRIVRQPGTVPFPESVAKVARAYHEFRVDEHSLDYLALRRRRGRSAGQTLFDVFSRLGAAVATPGWSPWVPFLSLSFQLNLLSNVRAERCLIAEIINTLVPHHECFVPPAGLERLTKLARVFLASGDARAFINEAVALPEKVLTHSAVEDGNARN